MAVFHYYNVFAIICSAIVDYDRVVRTALGKPEINARLRSLGAVVAGSTPQGFREFLVEDLERWRTLITAARITAEGG